MRKILFILLLLSSGLNAQTFTFECLCAYLTAADANCDICNANIQSRLFKGILIRKDGTAFKWIDQPYIVQFQGNNATFRELIPNGENITITLAGTPFDSIPQYQDSIKCPCAGSENFFIAGPGIYFSGDTISAFDISPTNEIQRVDTFQIVGGDLIISLLNDGVPYSSVTLPVPTGAETIINAGTGISVTGSGTIGSPYIVTNTLPHIATDLTFSGASSPVTLNSSTGTDVTITAGGINSFSATGTNITITATEVDGSTTNELQTLANTSDATSHTATLSNSGGSIKLVEGTNISLATTGTTADGVVTITNTGAAALSGVVNQLPYFNTTTTITTESGSGANSIYWNATTNKMSIGSTGGAGVLNVEYPGGLAFDRAIEFTNSGGWTNRWIEMYAAATGSRGFSFGGQNNVGADVDNVLVVSPWPSGRVAINKDPSVDALNYSFELAGVTNTDGLVISRLGSPTDAAMWNMNSSGDGILRTKSGFWTLGDLDVIIGSQDPSAILHLFGPSGATIDPIFRMDKQGGFGSGLFELGYSGGEKFIYLGNGTTRVLTVRSNNAETLTRIGINQTSPVQTLHVQGTARITGSDGTGTDVLLRDADGDISSAGLSGLSIISGTLTATDGSVTNEAQTLTIGGTTTGTISLNAISGVGGGTATIAAGTGITVAQSGGTITITNSSPATAGWLLDGNTITTAKRIGSNDNFDVVVETNGTDRMWFDNGGTVSIGATQLTTAALNISGLQNNIGQLIAGGSGLTAPNFYQATGSGSGSTATVLSGILSMLNGNVEAHLRNTSTSGTGGTVMELNAKTATGDPRLYMTIDGTTDWSIGIDNDDVDNLKLHRFSSPSDNNGVGTLEFGYDGTSLGLALNKVGIGTATNAHYALDALGKFRADQFVNNSGATVTTGTYALGTAAGTSPTLDSGVSEFWGNGGRLKFTSGTSPTANGVICTVTLGTEYTFAECAPILQGRTTNTGGFDYVGTFNSGTRVITYTLIGTLAASTNYEFNLIISGRN